MVLLEGDGDLVGVRVAGLVEVLADLRATREGFGQGVVGGLDPDEAAAVVDAALGDVSWDLGDHASVFDGVVGLLAGFVDGAVDAFTTLDGVMVTGDA